MGFLAYLGSLGTAIATYFGIKLALKIVSFAVYMGIMYYITNLSYSFIEPYLDFSSLPNNIQFFLCKLKIIQILNFLITTETTLFFLKKSVNFWFKNAS